MDSKNRFSFALSKTGASHLPKGIPCQDYSLSWDSEDGQNLIVIVCDGHGSSTYVRSDIGSKLAAEITKAKLLDFIAMTNPSVFLNRQGAVTARPSLDDSKWGLLPSKPETSMTEVEALLYKQNQQFYQQVKEIREQDTVICDVFEKIYYEWLDSIKKDSVENPFTDTERAALGNNDLVKAYGTTLIAYVQTPFYWLAFHIGDGRIVASDRYLNWPQPVPWDCNCFQNYTTSLCSKNPLISFRYAFNGKGEFPVAVMCCSDGIEDSYGDFDIAPSYLLNFYTGLLNTTLVESKDCFLEKLNVFLPKLSTAGSKDDMSLAGFVCLDAIRDGLKECELRNQRDKLNAEHAERMNRQKQLEAELNKLQKELEELKDKLSEVEHKKHSILEKLKDLILQEENLRSEETDANRNIAGYQSQIKDYTTEIEKMLIAINKEIDDNKVEDENARIQKAELKSQFDKLEEKIAELKKADMEVWQEFVAENLNKTDMPSVEMDQIDRQEQ